MKKIIVCCDGTGQNGTVMVDPRMYTNILRLARSINPHDDKGISQIVFYQSGVGSEYDFYTEYLKELSSKKQTSFIVNTAHAARELYTDFVSKIEGMTGGPLADKVQEAYGFIAQNYEPGDKLFLFGFSRGAYTARMVAGFIGEIGILTRKGMERFGTTFVNYQINSFIPLLEDRVKASQQIKDELIKASALFPDSMTTNGFSVECVGVFDTVGSVGLPKELAGLAKPRNMFGFSDNKLGAHIRKAYQALALDEKRGDFLPILFEQTDAGRDKKQTLVQCWFAGSHSNIGGSYLNHDLSDLSLIWMAANIEDMISLNKEYLRNIPSPSFDWGTQPPTISFTGVYASGDKISRRITLTPTVTDILPFYENHSTHEYIHPSVLKQKTPTDPDLVAVCKARPAVVCGLQPFELTMREVINNEPKLHPAPERDETVSWPVSEAEKLGVKLGKFLTNDSPFWAKFAEAL